MMKLSLICLLCSFGLSFLLCRMQIPLLKRVGAGQNILHYVKEHQTKSGTPTMGGLGFVMAATVCALIFTNRADKPLQATLAIGLGYLVVGFLDDALKKYRKQNLGLKPYQKIVFQLLVALIASVYCYQGGRTSLKIPFTTQSLDLSWGIIPFGVLVFLATVNSVNLTDGLDGLAGGVSAVFFFCVALLLRLQGENEDLSLLSLCLMGALAAYLIFNTNRASIFMGDTGSLSLGGFAAAITLFTGNALILPIVGIMFMFSSISVIIQVIYYKKTGKRIFLMSPIHHHFQEKGYSEGKITYAYCVVTAIMGIALLLPFV